MISLVFWLMAAINLLWSCAHLLPDRYTCLLTFTVITLWLAFKCINHRRGLKTDRPITNSRNRLDKPTPEQAMNDLMTKTPATYQKRLALAHHLKTSGNNPNLSNRFGPLEQKAGAKLAATKYPMSPELASQMKAGQFDPVTQLNTAVPQESQPANPANQPVDGQEVNLPETPELAAQAQAGNDQMRASFPRVTPPAPSLRKNNDPEKIVETDGWMEILLPQYRPELALNGGKFDSKFLDYIAQHPPKNRMSQSSSSILTRLLSLQISTKGFLSLVYGTFLICGLILLFLGWNYFHSYTGTVDGLHPSASGVAIYLDGSYPDQRMTLWVPKFACPSVFKALQHFPRPGTILTAHGSFSSYHGRIEIVITSASQLACKDSAENETAPRQ